MLRYTYIACLVAATSPYIDIVRNANGITKWPRFLAYKSFYYNSRNANILQQELYLNHSICYTLTYNSFITKIFNP